MGQSSSHSGYERAARVEPRWEDIPGEVPPADGPWRTRIFQCGVDTETCLTGLFCPCVLFGRNVEALWDGTSLVWPCICHAICVEVGISIAVANATLLSTGMITALTSCQICCGMLFCWVGNCLFFDRVRVSLQGKYHLENSSACDVFAHCCFHCCALCQEHREVKAHLSDVASAMTVVNPPPIQEMESTGDAENPPASSTTGGALEMQSL